MLRVKRGLRLRRLRCGGATDKSYPVKSFYQTSFAGVANNTTLRSLSGWAAYNHAGSTGSNRDLWKVQSEAITIASSTDFNTRPGEFVVARDAGSTNHILRATLKALPASGSHLVMAAAATTEQNCVFLECTNVSGAMGNFIIQKNVGGTLTQLVSLTASLTTLGRSLIVGDVVELHILGQVVHLFVNGYRITAAAGVSLDTGGAFTKGQLTGFGTRSGGSSVFDDVYIAAMSADVTITDTPIFWPGLLGVGRSVSLAGTYSGTVSDLDYRVVNATTQAVVKNWSRVHGATITGGNWSASMLVPMCDTTTNPQVRVQVRAANDTDAVAQSNAFAVGVAIGSYGQSNSQYRGQVSATSYSAPNGYMYSSGNGLAWLSPSPTTAHSQKWASVMAAKVGIPVGVFVGGRASQSIVNLIDQSAGMPWADMLTWTASANAYGYIYGWLWTQGEAESDSASVFDETAYRSNFDTLLGLLRGPMAASNTAPVGVCVIGKNGGTHISGQTFGDANWSAARAALWNLTNKPNVSVATGLFDGTLDGTLLHYVPDSYVENGRRAAESLLGALGYSADYNGRGPIVTGATRSGATITLAVNLNGAVSLSGSGLTHYQVSTDNFATTKTINSAAVSGGNIVLTLSADPGAAVKVRSFYGMNFTSPTYALGTYADATTIPVEPLYVPVASN